MLSSVLALLGLSCTSAPPSAEVPLGVREPMAQLAAVEAALDEEPQQIPALCAQVTASPARDRCARIQTRPHLWQRPPEAAAAAEGLPTRYRAVEPATTPCQGHAQARACWSQLAYGHAVAARPTQAASACAAISATVAREECLFQAAEASIEHREAEGYADALDLCGASGRFARDCLEHATSLLAEAHAPAAPTADPSAWARLLEDDAAIVAAWSPLDPARGAGEVDRLWASALAFVYTHAVQVTGAPLGVLPSRVAVHVRAAAAWRLLHLSPDPARDIEGWRALLSERLADRGEVMAAPTGPGAAGGRRALPTLPPMAPLPPPAPGEREVSWLGVDRRLAAEDPRTDERLSVQAALRHRVGVP